FHGNISRVFLKFWNYFKYLVPPCQSQLQQATPQPDTNLQLLSVYQHHSKPLCPVLCLMQTHLDHTHSLLPSLSASLFVPLSLFLLSIFLAFLSRTTSRPICLSCLTLY